MSLWRDTHSVHFIFLSLDMCFIQSLKKDLLSYKNIFCSFLLSFQRERTELTLTFIVLVLLTSYPMEPSTLRCFSCLLPPVPGSRKCHTSELVFSCHHVPCESAPHILQWPSSSTALLRESELLTPHGFLLILCCTQASCG